MTGRPLLIFEPEIQEWMAGRVLNPAFAMKWQGAMLWPCVQQLAESAGWSMVTADMAPPVSEWTDEDCYVVMINRLPGEVREVLLASRATRKVGVCLESPLTAFDFFRGLQEYSGWFDELFAFAGARARVAGQTRFHPILWPHQGGSPVAAGIWSERRFSVLVNSNRRADMFVRTVFDPRHPRSSLRRRQEREHSRELLARDPFFGPELYLDRLQMIETFAERDFNLFGWGWDRPVEGATRSQQAAVRKAYRGTIPRRTKIEVMSQYRFSVCFENTVFPGYVTEKIIDSLLAGCIPLYYGAPDIAEHVWPETFVDYRSFSGPEDALEGLLNLDDSECRSLVDAGRTFLCSSDFERFSARVMAREVFDAIRAGGRAGSTGSLEALSGEGGTSDRDSKGVPR